MAILWKSYVAVIQLSSAWNAQKEEEPVTARVTARLQPGDGRAAGRLARSRRINFPIKPGNEEASCQQRRADPRRL
jgi:hypothetical protein